MEQFNASDHDIGFKMYCSYGNGWLLSKDEKTDLSIVYSPNYPGAVHGIEF